MAVRGSGADAGAGPRSYAAQWPRGVMFPAKEIDREREDLASELAAQRVATEGVLNARSTELRLLCNRCHDQSQGIAQLVQELSATKTEITARLLETPAVHERLEAELRQERSEREELQHELAAEQEDAWTAKDEVAKAVAMRASLQRQLEATTQLQEEDREHLSLERTGRQELLIAKGRGQDESREHDDRVYRQLEAHFSAERAEVETWRAVAREEEMVLHEERADRVREEQRLATQLRGSREARFLLRDRLAEMSADWHQEAEELRASAERAAQHCTREESVCEREEDVCRDLESERRSYLLESQLVTEELQTVSRQQKIASAHERRLEDQLQRARSDATRARYFWREHEDMLSSELEDVILNLKEQMAQREELETEMRTQGSRTLVCFRRRTLPRQERRSLALPSQVSTKVPAAADPYLASPGPTVRLVVFEFENVLATIDVFQVLAGQGDGAQEFSVARPFALTERGQVRRIVELGDSGTRTSFVTSAFGGNARVMELRRLLQLLRSHGVVLIVCSTLVGTAKKCLADASLLLYFSEVFGHVGSCGHGETEYDRAASRDPNDADDAFLGSDMEAWPDPGDLVMEIMRGRRLAKEQVVYVGQRDVHQVSTLCRVIPVRGRGGMTTNHISQLTSLTTWVQSRSTVPRPWDVDEDVPSHDSGHHSRPRDVYDAEHVRDTRDTKPETNRNRSTGSSHAPTLHGNRALNHSGKPEDAGSRYSGVHTDDDPAWASNRIRDDRAGRRAWSYGDSGRHLDRSGPRDEKGRRPRDGHPDLPVSQIDGTRSWSSGERGGHLDSGTRYGRGEMDTGFAWDSCRAKDEKGTRPRVRQEPAGNRVREPSVGTPDPSPTELPPVNGCGCTFDLRKKHDENQPEVSAFIGRHYKKTGFFGAITGAFGDRTTMYCHHMTSNGEPGVLAAGNKRFGTVAEAWQHLGKQPCTGRFAWTGDLLKCGGVIEKDHDRTCTAETCIFVASGLPCPTPEWAFK